MINLFNSVALYGQDESSSLIDESDYLEDILN